MLDYVTDTDRQNQAGERLFYVQDDAFADDRRREVDRFLRARSDTDGWTFGWRSRGKGDTFSFWHRHFAGYRKPEAEAEAYDCEPELKRVPVIHAFWHQLAEQLPAGHRLIRCYANGLTYGSDGTVHIDTSRPSTYTCLYYPHESWNPDWGGETMFFNQAKDDVIACVYPRPNRMVFFDGTIPHVARGVSRLCPVLRVTLMFKIDRPDNG